MKDYIEIERIWQSDYYFQVKITCISESITVTNKIYTSNECIDELFSNLEDFLDGKVKECLWLNGEKGDGSTACVSFEFSHKDKLGHILVEVYIEIDDGGNYSNHNCCFYVNTEIGLLSDFKNDLWRIKEPRLGEKIALNHF